MATEDPFADPPPTTQGQRDPLPEVTRAEEEAMREFFSRIVTTSGGKKRLHPTLDGERPICRIVHSGHGPTSWRLHDFAAFPFRYREICRHCGRAWRLCVPR